VETVTTLFALADKCARAAEGRAWHSAPQEGPTQMRGSSVAAPGGSKKKNKKNRSANKPQTGAPVAAATTAGGQNLCNKRPRQQCGDSGSCPVHPGACHSASKCCEILKLAERVSKRREQASKDDSSPPQRRTLRASTPSPTPSSGVMSTARNCTSCTAVAQSSSPGETSRLFAGKFSR
jgi:hypothetical protein